VSVLTPDLIEIYRTLNGPAVANAIETFGVRLRNEGFADSRLRCLRAERSPAIGHAVTARIQCSSPPPVGHRYHDRTDWWNYIVSVPAPRFVVVQDVDPRAGLGAFVGDLHAAILQALDCVAYATNGSVRDADRVSADGFGLFASGFSVSHAFAHIVDFGGPVDIAGLSVSTGDVLFGDADGLQSIPGALVESIPPVAKRMETREEHVIAFCRSSRFSVDGLRALVGDLE
jgi:regulator of RNase E activity RraA